jgi:hypothetical protein
MFLMIGQPIEPSQKKNHQIMHLQLINMQKIWSLKIYNIYTFIYMPQNIYTWLCKCIG